MAKIGVLVVLLFSASWLPAQCCLGAQNAQVHTQDKRFLVKAISLSGTGTGNHGPYHYRFLFLVRSKSGQFLETGRFERCYLTREHFQMTILPSPSGNGFFVRGPSESGFTFFGPAGQNLGGFTLSDSFWFSVDDSTKPTDDQDSKSDPKRSATLKKLGIISCNLAVGGQRNEVSFLLPLFTTVDSRTRTIAKQKRLVAFVEFLSSRTLKKEKLQAQVTPLIRILLSKKSADASDKLLALGPQILPLFAALKLKDRNQVALSSIRDKLLFKTFGHVDAKRNVVLLGSLLASEDKIMVAAALKCFDELLPPKLPRSAEWILMNLDNIQTMRDKGELSRLLPEPR